MLNFAKWWASGERWGLLPGAGWEDVLSYRFRDREQRRGEPANPTAPRLAEPRSHWAARPAEPPRQSYLRPLARAADVVGHPGRLVHAGAGGRTGKLDSGRGTPRSLARAPAEWRRGRRKERTGCPRTGTLAPSARVCSLVVLPASRLQNKTRNIPRPTPGTAFPPPPSKAGARRARFHPPPALRGRRGSGEGWLGSARLGTAGPGRTVRSALLRGTRRPTPRWLRSPARPPPQLPRRRSEPGSPRGALTSSALFGFNLPSPGVGSG